MVPSSPYSLGTKLAFSIGEFCAAVSIGRSRAYEEIAAGRLKIVKCGGRSLISVDEARAWLHRLAAATDDNASAPTA